MGVCAREYMANESLSSTLSDRLFTLIGELYAKRLAGEDISDLIYQLEEFYSDLISLDLNGIVLPQEAVALINDSLYTLTSTNTLMADHSEQPSCGRPFICISCEQLEYLIDLNFTAVSIAGILGVSRSTVYRRFKDYGLSIRNKYSSISDEMLDEIVQKILQQYPDCGQKMMSGHLKERGTVLLCSRCG